MCACLLFCRSRASGRPEADFGVGVGVCVCVRHSRSKTSLSPALTRIITGALSLSLLSEETTSIRKAHNNKSSDNNNGENCADIRLYVDQRTCPILYTHTHVERGGRGGVGCNTAVAPAAAARTRGRAENVCSVCCALERCVTGIEL